MLALFPNVSTAWSGVEMVFILETPLCAVWRAITALEVSGGSEMVSTPTLTFRYGEKDSKEYLWDSQMAYIDGLCVGEMFTFKFRWGFGLRLARLGVSYEHVLPNSRELNPVTVADDELSSRARLSFETICCTA
jgi:hypothetical protein